MQMLHLFFVKKKQSESIKFKMSLFSIKQHQSELFGFERKNT